MKTAPSRPSTQRQPPWLYRVAGQLLGPLEKMLGITCRDFAELSSENHECPLTGSKKFRYLLHRLVCAICRKQERRMRHLNQLAGDVVCKSGCDHSVALPPEARERIRETVAQEISRTGGEKP